MDVKVNFGGVEAVITVADAHEAATLLSSLSNQKTSVLPPAPVRQVVPTTAIPSASKIDLLALETTLRDLQGTRAAPLLSALSKSREGLSDAEIRNLLGLEAKANFGPAISTVSKACVRHRVLKEHVILSAQRRMPDKKIEYLYKITPEAADIVKSIPDFDKKPGFPVFTRK